MALWCRMLCVLAEIVYLRKPTYDASTLPNVTQHYCAILECSKLYMLVGAGQ